MRELLALALIVVAPAAWASCFPENDLNIPVAEDYQADAIAESAFNTAIDKVYKVYAPVAKKLGYTLIFNRQWSDGTVNSSTYVDGDRWVVNSYGGLARYPGMNSVAAYAAVACHEVGHHLGGAPLYSSSIPWASVEGEADYWATKECMKAIGYGSQAATDASVALAQVLARMGGESMPADNRIDTRIARSTVEGHPPAQCRLDTFLNGLACPQRGAMSKRDPRVHSCFSYPSNTTYALGSRPRCWFKP